MSGSGYLFDNRDSEAGERFDALSTLLDHWTTNHLDRLGVGEGWRCLEVGAGGGSIAGWLGERVGGSGHVLATDLDVRWLEARMQAPNVEIRTLDLSVDPIPEDRSTWSMNAWSLSTLPSVGPSCPDSCLHFARGDGYSPKTSTLRSSRTRSSTRRHHRTTYGTASPPASRRSCGSAVRIPVSRTRSRRCSVRTDSSRSVPTATRSSTAVTRCARSSA